MTSSTTTSTGSIVLALNFLGLHDLISAAGFQPVAMPHSRSGWEKVNALAPEIGAVITGGMAPLSDKFMNAAVNLKIIACIGAGYEGFDPAKLLDRGIRLVNGRGVNADDVADLTIGLFIAARRRIVEADAWVKQGQWAANTGFFRSIRGNRMGIIGLGAIGRAVAARGQVMGMTIGWSGPNPKDVDWLYFRDPLELARWSDALFVCCRPADENENLINAEMLNALGPHGTLINISRGTLVDEDALIAALREGRIAAAGLDVFKEEPTDPEKWKDVPNLTLHPHRGGATLESLQQCLELGIENLRRCFNGEELLTPLN